MNKSAARFGFFGEALKLLQQARALCRFTSFDLTTEHGRSLERYRRILFSSATALVAKVINTLFLLVSVPLTSTFLGKERYGLWITITSVAAMLSFADLGLGGGAVNQMSAAYGKDDKIGVRKISSNLFAAMMIPSMVLLVLFSASYPFVVWKSFYRVVSEQASVEAGPSTAIFIITFLLSMPLATTWAVYTASQESFKANMWQIAISLVQFASLLLAVYFKANLIWLTLAYCGSGLIVKIVNFVVLTWIEKPWIIPRRVDVEAAHIKQLMRSGSLFFIISISIAIGYTSDTLVIAQMMGADAVPEYSVPYRLFSIVTLLVTSFLAPMWPAYSEAFSRGDYGWAVKTLKKSLMIVILINTLSGIAMYFLGRWIIAIWVGPIVSPSNLLLFSFALYLMAHGIHGPISMFLNGLHVVRLQAILWASMAVVNLPLSILLTKSLGVSGVVFGTAISTVLCFVIPAAIYTLRMIRKLDASPSIIQQPAVEDVRT